MLWIAGPYLDGHGVVGDTISRSHPSVQVSVLAAPRTMLAILLGLFCVRLTPGNAFRFDEMLRIRQHHLELVQKAWALKSSYPLSERVGAVKGVFMGLE